MKQAKHSNRLLVRITVISGCAIMALLLRFAAIDEFGIGSVAGNIVFTVGLALFTGLYYGLASSKELTTEKNKIALTRSLL